MMAAGVWHRHHGDRGVWLRHRSLRHGCLLLKVSIAPLCVGVSVIAGWIAVVRPQSAHLQSIAPKCRPVEPADGTPGGGCPKGALRDPPSAWSDPAPPVRPQQCFVRPSGRLQRARPSSGRRPLRRAKPQPRSRMVIDPLSVSRSTMRGDDGSSTTSTSALLSPEVRTS